MEFCANQGADFGALVGGCDRPSFRGLRQWGYADSHSDANANGADCYFSDSEAESRERNDRGDSAIQCDGCGNRCLRQRRDMVIGSAGGKQPEPRDTYIQWALHDALSCTGNRYCDGDEYAGRNAEQYGDCDATGAGYRGRACVDGGCRQSDARDQPADLWNELLHGHKRFGRSRGNQPASRSLGRERNDQL